MSAPVVTINKQFTVAFWRRRAIRIQRCRVQIFRVPGRGVNYSRRQKWQISSPRDVIRKSAARAKWIAPGTNLQPTATLLSSWIFQLGCVCWRCIKIPETPICYDFWCAHLFSGVCLWRERVRGREQHSGALRGRRHRWGGVDKGFNQRFHSGREIWSLLRVWFSLPSESRLFINQALLPHLNTV